MVFMMLRVFGNHNGCGQSDRDEEHDEQGREEREATACTRDAVAHHLTASLWGAAWDEGTA
jgi:hypothetical protein